MRCTVLPPYRFEPSQSAVFDRGVGEEVYGPMYEEAEFFEKVTVLKAALELGWEPRVGLDELVLETADYQTHEDYREARESSRVT